MKALTVNRTSITRKCRMLVPGIHLIDDEDDIECNAGKVKYLVLKTSFLKKVWIPDLPPMSFDTTAANKRLHRFDERDSVWLFGYGSLIFKPDFPFIDHRPASIRHWTRRFWQGSQDHRGTAQAPGRVVTLVAEPGAVCDGLAYLITPQVFDHLDHREKNGYLRFMTEMIFDDGSSAHGLVYIATAENAAYLGPATEAEIARQIAGAQGPSGRNRDYLIDLADALRALQKQDAHVFAIERYLSGDAAL